MIAVVRVRKRIFSNNEEDETVHKLSLQTFQHLYKVRFRVIVLNVYALTIGTSGSLAIIPELVDLSLHRLLLDLV